MRETVHPRRNATNRILGAQADGKTSALFHRKKKRSFHSADQGWASHQLTNIYEPLGLSTADISSGSQSNIDTSDAFRFPFRQRRSFQFPRISQTQSSGHSLVNRVDAIKDNASCCAYCPTARGRQQTESPQSSRRSQSAGINWSRESRDQKQATRLYHANRKTRPKTATNAEKVNNTLLLRPLFFFRWKQRLNHPARLPPIFFFFKNKLHPNGVKLKHGTSTVIE